MIQKTLDDISAFNGEKAASEVDKFLMDGEMVNLYIQFQKEKEKDPDFVVPGAEEEEELFSFRNLVFAYIAYVVFFKSGPVAFRNWVAQQEAAGTWHGSGIQAIDDWLANTPAVPVPDAAVTETVQTVSDAVQSSGLQ